MNPLYRQTRFLASAHRLDQLPPDRGLEVAFAGRSNAGKSSALNAITGQRGLARTSKTPGRTQLINLFSISPGRCLVDLPGYGYARVPERLRAHWQRVLPTYLTRRGALRGVMLIMDVRHPLKEFDRQMLRWADAAGLPVHVLLNKADKLKHGAAKRTLAATRHALATDHRHASVQLFSALHGHGVEEAHRVLDRWLEVAGGGAAE